MTLAAALLWAACVAGCATTRAATRPTEGQVGIASYYAGGHQGRRTASGERFDMKEMTAAHRTLPFGTRVRVTNLANGRRVVVPQKRKEAAEPPRRHTGRSSSRE